jgi:hypothetical protein
MPRMGKETFNFLGFTHICSRSRRGVLETSRWREGRKYLVTLSSIESLPSSTSIMMAAETNCLPTEPDWKMVSHNGHVQFDVREALALCQNDRASAV